jgi:hypothetical protein
LVLASPKSSSVVDIVPENSLNKRFCTKPPERSFYR